MTTGGACSNIRRHTGQRTVPTLFAASIVLVRFRRHAGNPSCWTCNLAPDVPPPRSLNSVRRSASKGKVSKATSILIVTHDEPMGWGKLQQPSRHDVIGIVLIAPAGDPEPPGLGQHNRALARLPPLRQVAGSNQGGKHPRGRRPARATLDRMERCGVISTCLQPGPLPACTVVASARGPPALRWHKRAAAAIGLLANSGLG